MNDQKTEALSVLAEICQLSPEVRLGQLMAHLGFMGETHVDKTLANIDDDELLAILYRHRAELQARDRGEPAPFPITGEQSTSVSGSPISKSSD